MSLFKKTFWALIIGGFFFIIPVVVLIFLFGKAIALLIPIGKKLAVVLDLHSLFGLAAVSVTCVILLLLICYVSGLLITKGFVNQWSKSVEEKLFLFFPGFQMLKYRMLGKAHQRSKDQWKAILLREGNFYRIAFITDESAPELCSVFIPDAPKMDAGEVRLIPKEELDFLPIPFSEAIVGLNRFGRGITHKKFKKAQ